MECLFCKIVNGEVPAVKVYETDRIISFLDIFPINKGHLLVLPKKHYDSLSDASPEDLAAMMEGVKRLSQALVKAFDLQGYNVLLNVGRIAGQVIPHLHVHVIPRHAGDGVSVPGGHTKAEEPELQKVRETIIREVAG